MIEDETKEERRWEIEEAVGGRGKGGEKGVGGLGPGKQRDPFEIPHRTIARQLAPGRLVTQLLPA